MLVLVMFWKPASRCQVQIAINLVETPWPLDHVEPHHYLTLIPYRRLLGFL